MVALRAIVQPHHIKIPRSPLILHYSASLFNALSDAQKDAETFTKAGSTFAIGILLC